MAHAIWSPSASWRLVLPAALLFAGGCGGMGRVEPVLQNGLGRQIQDGYSEFVTKTDTGEWYLGRIRPQTAADIRSGKTSAPVIAFYNGLLQQRFDPAAADAVFIGRLHSGGTIIDAIAEADRHGNGFPVVLLGWGSGEAGDWEELRSLRGDRFAPVALLDVAAERRQETRDPNWRRF